MLSSNTKLALLVTALLLSAVAGVCIAIKTGDVLWTVMAIPVVAFIFGVGG